MTRATVRRWTHADHPCPWEYRVTKAQETVGGHMPTWQRAFNRALQLIADQT